jgi:hypothetical protein
MFYDSEINVSYWTSILFKFTGVAPVHTFLSVAFGILIIKFVTDSSTTIFYIELVLF